MPATAPPLTGRYFECGIPDANLKIQLNGDVMSRISAAALGGFTTMRRRALEIGGVLFGREERGCILIDSFEEIVSEHERGPSWLLSANDGQLLAEAVERAGRARDGARIVGLYRTHTRAGFAISDDDVALMHQHCRAGVSVFLLVKPAAAGASVAMFAAGDGLQATSEVFSFRPNASGALPAPAAGRPRSESLMPPPEKAMPLADPEPEEKSNRRARTAWALAILLAAFAGGYGVARWWMAAQKDAPPAKSMALRAIWNGSNLDLRWDRNAKPVQLASGGMLWIHDGGQYRRVDVTREDLSQGSIAYWPLSRDLVFHLDVFTPKETVAEWVRAVGLPFPERAPVVAPPAAPEPAKMALRSARPDRPARRRTSVPRAAHR